MRLANMTGQVVPDIAPLRCVATRHWAAALASGKPVGYPGSGRSVTGLPLGGGKGAFAPPWASASSRASSVG